MNEEIVDVSGTPLKIGDKVAVNYQQLFRIGIILKLTPKRVVVGFDFTAQGNALETDRLEEARFSPWKLAKVVNQNVGLRDYFDHIKV